MGVFHVFKLQIVPNRTSHQKMIAGQKSIKTIINVISYFLFLGDLNYVFYKARFSEKS